MRIALIIGASSGLGMEFSKNIDLTEPNIDEIWLVARRNDRLEKVAMELSHPSKTISMDISKNEDVEKFEEILEREKPEISVFINCAGFAKIGNYEKISRFDSVNMIDVNCKGAVNMTLACVPYMKAQDRIIHICSTAAFQPLQHLNIYAASKAFLYNYTRALRLELLPKGIVVTAVCPWWVKNTEFIGVAKDNSKNEAVEQSIKSFQLASKPETVVKWALFDSRAGFAVSTPSPVCFLHRVFSKILPRKCMMYLWELVRRV